MFELGLRAAHYGGDTPLFEAPNTLHGRYLIPARRVAARYFPRAKSPPSPSADAFLAQKPAHGLRIFVMGESAAAGFPYPANAAFSNVVRDALQDVLPTDTVEVVNLGIAATNSYTIADLTREVIAQRPDAILIYAGHNEYYGALGAGSAETLGAFPAFVRLYLKLQRLKTFLLLRNLVAICFAAVRGESSSAIDPHPSRMETVVRDQRITLGGTVYERGKRQFESNLLVALSSFRRAGVPVFIGSIPSNLRDLRPFGSLAAPRESSATVAFDSARARLSRADTAGARNLFAHARDLDLIRFRAPGEFREIIQHVAQKTGAHYVPSEEAFASATPDGIPGKELFLEHVHPNADGYLLLGKTYFEALQRAGFVGRTADMARLASWGEYRRRMDLTPLDERIVYHTIRTITTRWPFVPLNAQQNYRGSYRPTDFTDSIAFDVSMGTMQWAQAKVAAGHRFERRGHADSAVEEYLGIMRREPQNEAPYRLAGAALVAVKEPARARLFLEKSYRIEPTAFTAYALGVIERQSGDPQRGVALLEQSLTLSPDNPAALYQLSLSYAVTRDLPRARATAARLAMVKPGYPGLVPLAAALGMGAR